jgi:pimeloyl-ACP methyl ester carboxylesterase
MAVRTTTRAEPQAGTFSHGMEYLRWGAGPRTAVFLPGGPGSSVPTGMWRRAAARWFAPFLAAGFTVWQTTRARHMPAGHGVADMADDVARLLDDEFGGTVDLVVGESFGGMIAQELAGRHPACTRALALVVTGCEVSPWGKEVDRRLAAALRRGDRTAAGEAFAEYVLPAPALRPVRRVLAPLVVRGLLDATPTGDLLVEVESELTFDSRAVLPTIQAPTLLVCGDQDRFFPPPVVRETAQLIPDCSLVWYSGAGHVRAASSSRVADDVLAFVAG